MLRIIKSLIPGPIFRALQPLYHRTLAVLSAAYYGFPARDLKVIGVTGTNGKSTVVEMLHHIFETGGYPVASLSSVRIKFDEEERANPFKMTMPGRFFIQKFLWEAKDKGAYFVILEVTSEGIKQFRHTHIPFAAAVLTNLTPEHIEAHGGFENYKKAKGELFRALAPGGISIVNLEDKNADFFLSFPAKEKIGYALEKGRIQNSGFGIQGGKMVMPEGCEIKESGIRLKFGEGEVTASLKGRFNAENMLAALATAEALKVSRATVRHALASFRGVPGRMEEISQNGRRVVVDYAFTPNALRQVYQTLESGIRNPASAEASAGGQESGTSGKLICVLGAAGGGRDRWKRPELGRIAAEFCDRVIVTNEDPYDEDPRAIMDAVANGAGGKAEIIEDRGAAIRAALGAARIGDIVVITGKGAERSIALAQGKQIPWDDRAVVREALGQDS